MNQPRMFETEDLPLFSGTSPTVQLSIPSDATVHVQQTLPVNCNACLDTGRIDTGFCWCDAGGEAANTFTITWPAGNQQLSFVNGETDPDESDKFFTALLDF